MKTSETIWIAIATTIMSLLCACSDETEQILDSGAPGTLTLQLISSKQTEVTRASDDIEKLIGQTYIYFYTSNSEDVPAVYTYSKDFEEYSSSSLTLELSENDRATLFPNGATTCHVYAVTNLPKSVEAKISKNPTISEIKNQLLNSGAQFLNTSYLENFVMDGEADVTYDATTATMGGSIVLKRAAAKIMVSVQVPVKYDVSGTVYYEPIFKFSDADGTDMKESDFKAPQIEVYNAAYTGLVHGEADKEDLKLYSEPLTRTLTKNFTFFSKTYYTHDPIYLYPSSWSDDGNNDVHISVAIPWRRTETNPDDASDVTRSVVWFYYQMPIKNNNNVKTNQIVRNYMYNYTVELDVIVGDLDGAVVTADDLTLSYEVSDWTDDGTPINTTLDQSHYLVVQDNTFEVFNENSLTFEYQSCDAVEAYVTEISYVSTRYDNDETIYLYKANYNESTNSYTEVSDDEYKSLSDHTSEVRKSKEEDIIKYIDDHVTKDMLSKSSVANDNVDDINGRITLTSAVSEIAEKLYRPVKYTVVVVNGTDHNKIRQTVTITQYPSKYIEFGAGGNVFVNGYYARLIPDEGYTKESLPGGSIENEDGYKSYNFVTSTYDESNKYYSSTENNLNTGIGYGSTGTDATKYASINSSYEYVRGNINSTTVSFKRTIDVHVTAFSGSDNYFTINKGSDKKYYKIGDPRIGGNFTNMQSHSTSYTYKGNELYEYYVKGDSYTTKEKHGQYLTSITHYNRYVEPWPDVDKIKVGGTATSYDEIISPLFKIQSTYGAAVYAPYFKVAQKRCATYQEAGYPAGRWRLPTLAEIAFIVKLQSASVIDLMFNKNEVGYWTCTGGKIVADDSFKYTANYDGTCYVRCVYDLWYWGSDQVTPTHEFHPMPTKQ